MKSTLFAAVLAALLCLPACAQHKDDWLLYRGRLKKDNKFWTINAVHVPDLFVDYEGLGTYLPHYNQAARVGLNTVCGSLVGFSDDYESFDPAMVQALIDAGQRAEDQRMALMVKVLDGIEGTDDRNAAVRTAAEALADVGDVAFWIDGPNARRLVRAFKRRAPNAIVLAPEGGDLTAVSDPADLDKLDVYTGPASGMPDGIADHYIVTYQDDVFALLDEMLMKPEERDPWTPDNSVLSEEERADGFVALFNERDFDGWWIWGSNKRGFEVNEAGEVEWVRGGAAALMTVDRYSDFVLRVDYKIEGDGDNSGIFLRAPRAARQSKIGMEFQIRGDFGVEPSPEQTGAVYDVLPALRNPSNPVGEWNEVEIRFEGPNLRATLNGELIQDVNFDEHEELRYRLRAGYIGLQDHSNKVWFRNVRIKRLDGAPAEAK